MADPTPVVPTLSGDSYLRDPSRIIAYALNFYFAAPKSAMVVWYDDAVSFKRTLARGKNSDESFLPAEVSKELTAMFSRIFGTPSQVNVTLVPGPDDITKILRIDVSVTVDGRPHTLDHNVTLSGDGRVTYALTQADAEEILTP